MAAWPKGKLAYSTWKGMGSRGDGGRSEARKVLVVEQCHVHSHVSPWKHTPTPFGPMAFRDGGMFSVGRGWDGP